MSATDIVLFAVAYVVLGAVLGAAVLLWLAGRHESRIAREATVDPLVDFDLDHVDWPFPR